MFKEFFGDLQRSDWEAIQFYYNRWIKVPESEKFLDVNTGMKKVLEGDFAYHTDVNNAFPLIERLFDNKQVCQLTAVHLVWPTEAAFFVALNGSFTELSKVG